MTLQERKTRDFKRREDEILTAALTLLDRDDWQSVTIDQIASKAEIGKGTIYKHFKSKDQIYALLAIKFGRGLLDKLRLVDPNQAVADYFDQTMTLYWEYHDREPKYRRLIRYCRRPDFRRLVGDNIRRDIDALDEEFLSTVGPVIVRGIQEGVVIDKPVHSLLLGVHALLMGAMELEIDGIDCLHLWQTTKEQLFAELKEFALRGVLRR